MSSLVRVDIREEIRSGQAVHMQASDLQHALTLAIEQIKQVDSVHGDGVSMLQYRIQEVLDALHRNKVIVAH